MNDQYAKYYSEDSLWEKIKKFSKAAGVKVIYAVLLLYYAMKDSGVSLKTKLFIAASLGYFIMPADAIIDFTPLIGYSDDLGVLLFALKQVSSAITPAVKEKARSKISDWFPQADENEMAELEQKMLIE
ncbi:MAG: YkvA family protein [Draconibacterium sp.]